MRRLTIALSATLLLLVGCSGDDETTDPTPRSEAADETTTSTVLDERTSEEILDEGGWLEDGRVAIGPAAPEEPEVNLAMCDYVVGAPEDVAEQLGVEADLTLDPESGFGYFGSNGGRLLCLYTEDGTEVAVVAIADREVEVDDEEAESVLVQTPLSGDWFGAVAVDPDWDGEITMDESSATEWLNDIDTRWGGAGV